MFCVSCLCELIPLLEYQLRQQADYLGLRSRRQGYRGARACIEELALLDRRWPLHVPSKGAFSRVAPYDAAQ